MRRQKTTILKEYETFVKAFENICRALGWKVKFKQDIDRVLQVVIDGCTYFVAPQTNDSPEQPVYYLSVLVTYRGNRDEPDSDDEKPIAESFRNPRKIVTALTDAHWSQVRQWALEQDWLPEDEKETWE